MIELHKFLKVFIFVQLGSCSAHVVKKYLDFVNNPELYAAHPWYYSITLTIILTAITVSITAIAYFIVGHIIKKHTQDQPTPESSE